MKKTLKNIAIIAILTIILLTLTGCANINYDIKLNEDGSGDIAYTMGYDKSFLKSIGVETTSVKNDDSLNDMKKEAEAKGYTIEDYEDDNTYGFKASKHVNNIQEEFNMNDEVSDNNEEVERIIYEKTLLKTKYSQDSKIDLTNMEEDEDAAILKALMAQMKISYRITLPFKATSNNATTVSEDGKTLEWVLKVGEINEIKFEAAKDYGMYALLGLAVVLVIVAAGSVILSRKAKKTVEAKPVEVKKEETKIIEKETQVDEKTENVEAVEEVETTEIIEEKEEVIEEVNKEDSVEEEKVEEQPVENEEKNSETKEKEVLTDTEETAVEDENKEK